MPNKKKTIWIRKHSSDLTVAFQIFVLPFLIYLHLFFNQDDSSTIIIFGQKFQHGFNNDEVFIWFLLKDIVPIGLFLVWFFMSDQKWKYSIILFISFFSYKILDILQFNSVACFAITFVFCLAIWFSDFLIFRKRRKDRIKASIKDLLFAQEDKSNYNLFNAEVINLLGPKREFGREVNFNKIFHLKSVLGVLLTRKIISEDSMIRTSKLNWSFGLILILNYALLFVHYLIPETQSEINLGFVSIRNNGFSDLSTFIWFITRKLVLILSMVVWFISCQEWWKYAILSPITIFTFQFWEAFQDQKHLDAYGNLTVAPIILLVLTIVFLLSKLVRYRIGLLEIYDYLKNEVDQILTQLNENNHEVNKSLIKYEKIKKEIYNVKNSKENLKNLVKLKQELLNILARNN